MSEAATNPDSFPLLEQLRRSWRRFAAAVLPGAGSSEADPATDRLLTELDALLKECRGQSAGDVSARSRAERLAVCYRGADMRQRAAMLNLITGELAPDWRSLESALVALQRSASYAETCAAEARLRTALDAPRAKFFAQLNVLPDGVEFLVDLRADLLALLPQEPALELLLIELDSLLHRWFDPGFLELRRITWQSPAAVLEKLIAHEAVHPIESWNDLRNRLDTDRRCYAFFHPRLPDEPLIFVEIALLRGMPGSVQLLLDQGAALQDARAADTAVFYSISNTQKGLRGISLGNLLLKRVIEDLRRELPWLRVFATLSPLPRFRKWTDLALAENRTPLRAGESEKVAQALKQPGWAADARSSEVLREPLQRLCAHYLMREKSGAQPLDPVAHFHLNNGARLNSLCWLADASERGMRQSYGMMASYRYDLADVDANHERFARDGHITAARRVLRLLD